MSGVSITGGNAPEEEPTSVEADPKYRYQQGENGDLVLVHDETGEPVSLEAEQAKIVAQKFDQWNDQSRRERGARIAKLVLDEDEDLRHLKNDPGNSLIRISLDELRILISLGVQKALKEIGR